LPVGVTVPSVGLARSGQLTMVQVGGGLDHVRSALQVLVRGSVEEVPGEQAYVAVAPKVVSGALTVPEVGAKGAPQSTGTQVGAASDQVPLAWHVRLGAPVRL
jgi:hypothetical protein